MQPKVTNKLGDTSSLFRTFISEIESLIYEITRQTDWKSDTYVFFRLSCHTYSYIPGKPESSKGYFIAMQFVLCMHIYINTSSKFQRHSNVHTFSYTRDRDRDMRTI